MAQHKATRRKSLTSAVKHKKLANTILDNIALLQAQLNSTMDKLDADTSVALDTDYEATLAIANPVEFDDVGTGAQHKQSLRRTLRSALAHKRLADEIADMMEEQQVAFNALLVKLDAQAGTLTDTDFDASLKVGLADWDGKGSEAQHKAPLRKSLQIALSHRALANDIVDALIALQESFNNSLGELDAGNVNGAHAALKVSVLDPDAPTA